MKNKLPKYLVRPSNFEIFYLNDDNETYSIRDKRIEHYVAHKYKYNVLINLGFFPCKKYEIKKYNEMQNEYYDEYKKAFKNDVHGGIEPTREYLEGKLKYFKPEN